MTLLLMAVKGKNEKKTLLLKGKNDFGSER